MMPFVILLFLIFLIFFYAFKLLLLWYQLQKPTLIHINPIFNKINRLEIKEATSSANFVFKLDNIEGQPITATMAAKVFFLPEVEPRFGYREKVYLIAKNIGFNTETMNYIRSKNEGIITDDKRKFVVDITNFNYKYDYNFEDDTNFFNDVMVPQKKTSEEKAIEFLKLIDRYPEDLAKGKTNVIFLLYNSETKKLTTLENESEANLVEVDFYRPDIDEFPIVSPKYFNSQNFVLMAFYKDGSYKVLRSQIKFFEKSNDQVGIYPLISGDKAYEDLKSGNSFIITNPSDQRRITLKKMFLGYLDSDYNQNYLQPVYVFLGENNFVAYVQAVAGEYLTD